VIGAMLVMNSDGFTIGMLVAFQMFSGRLSQPVLRLVGLYQELQQTRIAVQRLGDIMNIPQEPHTLTPPRARQDTQGARIELQTISFRYADTAPWLYRDLTLNIPSGRTVAIMGPSGCGKSTLAKLLQGFYWPQEGVVKIDNIDLRTMPANVLRSYLGVVPQETVLFSGTLYDNLLAAHPHASFDDIVTACKMAEIHSYIESLPEGYQTLVGERGVGLSGGQRQRIAIARALLKRPRILIFDEATSNLDAQTAEHFARTVNQLKGVVTMIFIAHAIPKGLQVDGIVKLGEQVALAKAEAPEGAEQRTSSGEQQ
jgi:ATP-binding cassette, subfamily B, bacterial HlyB/CyaB